MLKAYTRNQKEAYAAGSVSGAACACCHGGIRGAIELKAVGGQAGKVYGARQHVARCRCSAVQWEKR